MSLQDTWEKVKGWFRGVPSLHLNAYEPKDSPEAIVVPAKGGVYDFHLIPHFRWTSTNPTSIERLAEYASKYEENARSHLLQQVWAAGRDHDAFDVAGVERAISARVSSWCYPEERDVVRCTVKIRVLIDPRLREELHSVEARRMTLAYEFTVQSDHARNVADLTERWLMIFQRLERLPEMGLVERQFYLPFAAGLTDEKFQEITESLVARRRDWSVELATLLRVAQTDHEDVGLFEFARTYDKAVQTFCRQMGLDPLASIFQRSDDPPRRPAAASGAST